MPSAREALRQSLAAYGFGPAATEAIMRSADRMVEEARGVVLDKAKRWHDDGTMTDDEYGAVCASVIVLDAASMTDEDKAKAEAIADRFLAEHPELVR